MSFTNTSGTINLLVQTDILKQSPDKYPEYPAGYPCDNPSIVSVSLCIAHLSSDAYVHYRSLILQKAGMDFFSEPVSIVSNIENGYGCFSAINTVREIIAEYETYY
jgi:hypothetical protein